MGDATCINEITQPTQSILKPTQSILKSKQTKDAFNFSFKCKQ